MDLQQLRVFRVAARSNGFTHASEQLNLSQSTISQHIKHLEEALGCPLFLRVGKRVHLNDAGKLLLQYSDKIFQEIKNAEMAVSEMSTLQRGTIRLGVGATTLIYLLPKILTRFNKRYPQIELIVVTGSTEVLMQSVFMQTIDLAVVMQPIIPPPSIRIVPILKEELVVCLNASHPLATKGVLDAADLKPLPFITYLPGTAMQVLLESYFEAMNINPRVTMELENIEAIKSLVSVGLGTSVLPRCSIPGNNQNVSLKALRVRNFPMERELGLALPHSEILPIAIKKLADGIIKGISGYSRRTGEEVKIEM
ncbi:MAG: LysR family transcriptional regulator [Acidobacteriaceae bacterium]